MDREGRDQEGREGEVIKGREVEVGGKDEGELEQRGRRREGETAEEREGGKKGR